MRGEVQLVCEGWGRVEGLVGRGRERGCGLRGSEDLRMVGLGEGGRLRVIELGEYRSGRQARSKSYTCTLRSRHSS
jgi:hypothetical protein